MARFASNFHYTSYLVREVALWPQASIRNVTTVSCLMGGIFVHGCHATFATQIAIQHYVSCHANIYVSLLVSLTQSTTIRFSIKTLRCSLNEDYSQYTLNAQRVTDG